jgi:hemoglobin
MDWQPGPDNPPFNALGVEGVQRLVKAFYDRMESAEPALAALHRCDPPGRITRDSRDRFALFLVGWLGGPQDYMARHGHPRLRMRHGHVPVDEGMRDAWLRSMKYAMDQCQLSGELRRFLDGRFAEVADFLRNA